MSTVSSKKKKRPIPPLRSTNQNSSSSSDPPRSARAVGLGKGWKIQNDLDKVKAAQSRYPNYLPELKARRAKTTESENFKKENESYLLAPNSKNMDFEYNRIVLANLNRISNLSGNSSRFKVRTDEGHPLILPSSSTVRRLPKEVMSLYRAPDKAIDDWDLDSPLLAVDLMRKGLAVGPPLSQLPSPVSSQEVLFDIKGHRRKAYTRQQQR